MSSHSILFLTIAILLFSTLSPSFSKLEEDEDLSFLEEPDQSTGTDDTYEDHFSDGPHSDEEEDDGGYEDDFGNGNFSDFDEPELDPPSAVQIDEKDVVVLKEGNFSEAVKKNKFVMVEFYAPWCGHCEALAPEYAAAATEVKADGVVVAKVDATEENELAQEYNVEGFPTIYFFVDGVKKPYTGARTKDGIVNWIKKKIGPSLNNITSVDDAKHILATEPKVVLAFLNSLVGPESDELAAVSKGEDDISFYQTSNPDVAKLFHIDPEVKRPTLVLLKKEVEKISHFDGQFIKSAISNFVSLNKLPLLTIFSKETAQSIFESAIKKQLFLFVAKKNSEKVLSEFEVAAKSFKGQLIFVYVDLDNADYGRAVADYFGVNGDGPKVAGYAGEDESKKYFLDGEVNSAKIKAFGEDFLEDKLKPFYKSDPIPEANNGDVKLVVGNNFEDVVLDDSKDVLLEIYAPWCGHCQALEPAYNKLAGHLREINSIVIAKMDGTTNEHPRAKADGFPTILFYPAKNKSSDPIIVDTERTVIALYKFLKKNASIPFKLQKPDSTAKTVASNTEHSPGSSNSDAKDEL